MNSTRSAYSRGSPSRFGNGTEAPRLSCAACGSARSIGVPKMPGAMATTRMPNCDNSRAAAAVAGDVAMHRDAADFIGDLRRAVDVDVETGNFGAGLGQRRRGFGAEAGGGSRHNGGVSFGVHLRPRVPDAVQREAKRND